MCFHNANCVSRFETDLMMYRLLFGNVAGIPETSPQMMAATTMNLFPVANKLGDVSGASTRNAALMMSRNFASMELFPQNSGLVKEEISKKVDSRWVNTRPYQFALS